MSNVWALDLDEKTRPILAHLITRTYNDQRGEVRVAACGEEFTAGTHSRGWWSTEGDRVPLQDHAIHCGLVPGGSCATT